METRVQVLEFGAVVDTLFVIEIAPSTLNPKP